MSVSPPTAARLTPGGRGAVATVRYRGDAAVLDATPALFHAANGRATAAQTIDRVVFGQWGLTDIEDVVLCRVDESTLDVHCHGGAAPAARILNDLAARGCVVVTWQAFVEQFEGRFEAELRGALSRAPTLRTAGLLLEQHSGALRSAVESLLNDQGETRRATLQAMLGWSRFGLHLTEPWSVVLFGRPNVGKSSLINALLGYGRSIVFDEPGTTRDVVTAEAAFDGWPVRLADTAGIRDATDMLESSGIERARRHVAGADCRLLLLDTSVPPRDEDQQLLADFPDAIIIAHKCDLPDVWNNALPATALRVSSVTGGGLDALAQRIVSVLVPNVPEQGTAIPVTQRQTDSLREALATIEQGDEAQFRASLAALIA